MYFREACTDLISYTSCLVSLKLLIMVLVTAVVLVIVVILLESLNQKM